MRLVCISDTHMFHDAVDVPGGDVLIHAGDFTSRGLRKEVEAFARWFHGLPHLHKVVVAGNHDFLFETDPERGRELLGDVVYLAGEEATVAGLRFWGSPWQPWFHDWAFNLQRGEPLRAHWATAPSGIDVLVTHSPAMGTLDLVFRGENVGCVDLEAALPRIAPRLHVFGHIHEAAGVVQRADGILAVNASVCDVRYRPTNPAVLVDIGPEGPATVVR